MGQKRDPAVLQFRRFPVVTLARSRRRKAQDLSHIPARLQSFFGESF
jgi:hypothetical protein